jgi:hypothetical protein
MEERRNASSEAERVLSWRQKCGDIAKSRALNDTDTKSTYEMQRNVLVRSREYSNRSWVATKKSKLNCNVTWNSSVYQNRLLGLSIFALSPPLNQCYISKPGQIQHPRQPRGHLGAQM